MFFATAVTLLCAGCGVRGVSLGSAVIEDIVRPSSLGTLPRATGFSPPLIVIIVVCVRCVFSPRPSLRLPFSFDSCCCCCLCCRGRKVVAHRSLRKNDLCLCEGRRCGGCIKQRAEGRNMWAPWHKLRHDTSCVLDALVHNRLRLDLELCLWVLPPGVVPHPKHQASRVALLRSRRSSAYSMPGSHSWRGF